MKPEGSPTCSEEPATWPYPDLTLTFQFVNIKFNIILPSMPSSLIDLFPSRPLINFLKNFTSLMRATCLRIMHFSCFEVTSVKLMKPKCISAKCAQKWVVRCYHYQSAVPASLKTHAAEIFKRK